MKTVRRQAHVQSQAPHPPAVSQVVNGSTPLAAAPLIGTSRTVQTPAPRVADNDIEAGAGSNGGGM